MYTVRVQAHMLDIYWDTVSSKNFQQGLNLPSHIYCNMYCDNMLYITVSYITHSNTTTIKQTSVKRVSRPIYRDI